MENDIKNRGRHPRTSSGFEIWPPYTWIRSGIQRSSRIVPWAYDAAIPARPSDEKDRKRDSDTLLQFGIYLPERSGPVPMTAEKTSIAMARLSIWPMALIVETIAEARPRVPHLNRTHDGVGVRRGEEAIPEAEDCKPCDNDHKRRCEGDEHQDTEAGCCDRHPCRGKDTGFDPVREVARIGRDDHLDNRLSDEDKSRCLGIDAAVILQGTG
ncbi:MAG: hypothetical protein MZV70_30290 [Desulfobacterales bacterium]|nr:hypothetical protein [Desulfobacterales bacterium]